MADRDRELKIETVEIDINNNNCSYLRMPSTMTNTLSYALKLKVNHDSHVT